MERRNDDGNTIPDRKDVIGYWLPVLAWMGVIFWMSSLSSLPNHPDPLLETVIKKSGHVAEYAVLSLLLLRALHRNNLALPASPFFVSWLVAALYAVSDELHQSLTPGRTPSQFDVLLDVAAIAATVMAVRLVGRWSTTGTRG